MNEIRCLGYLGLGARDLRAWASYATEILGLEVTGREGDALLLRMDDQHFRIAIHESETEDALYLGWEVANADALTRLEADLRHANIESRRGTNAEIGARHVEDLISFRDPDGLVHEAYYGARVRTEKPFRSPLAISGFETGKQGLGHAFVSVRNYEKVLAFYRSVLGFRISDYIAMPKIPGVPDDAPPMTFLHCGSRHHSVAIAQFPGPKRINHIMLQVRSIDEVGHAFSRAQEKNVPMIFSLGRHSNDKMFSFYMESPSGIAFEYGYGAIEVDDATWVVQMHDQAHAWGHAPMAGFFAQLEQLKSGALNLSKGGV